VSEPKKKEKVLQIQTDNFRKSEKKRLPALDSDLSTVSSLLFLLFEVSRAYCLPLLFLLDRPSELFSFFEPLDFFLPSSFPLLSSCFGRLERGDSEICFAPEDAFLIILGSLSLCRKVSRISLPWSESPSLFFRSRVMVFVTSTLPKELLLLLMTIASRSGSSWIIRPPLPLRKSSSFLGLCLVFPEFPFETLILDSAPSEKFRKAKRISQTFSGIASILFVFSLLLYL
jgi:hypothetical protein